MSVHYRSLFPTLTYERHKVGIGDSDLPAEPVHRQIPFLDPASHRPGADLQKLGGLGNGVERGKRRGAGCGCRHWFLILFSLGHELSRCLAGEEADKLYESSGMRGEDSVDGGRPLSDRCFCISSMLVHDLPALTPYLDGRCRVRSRTTGWKF